MCGNQNVTVDSRILKVGVISTGGLVEPPKIILKNETLYYTLRGPSNARIPFPRTSILKIFQGRMRLDSPAVDHLWRSVS